VQELQLSGTQLGDSTCSELFQALLSNQRLEILHLERNHLSDAALAKHLPYVEGSAHLPRTSLC